MANNDKTMDVSKPGKVAADASSRPVIVTHRPMVQDPMVKPEAEVSDFEPQKDSPKENKSAPTSGEKVIQPIDTKLKADSSDIDKAAAAAASSKQKATTNPEAKGEETPGEVADATTSSIKPTDETAEKAPAEEKAEDATKESPATEATTDKPVTTSDDETSTASKDEAKKPSSTSEAAEVNAMVDQAAASKHKEKVEAEQEAAQQERLQKLIEEKKYFVKTGQVARRRNNRIALAFLILIVLLIGLYLAVDAGAIKPGFNVPIHVIHT